MLKVIAEHFLMSAAQHIQECHDRQSDTKQCSAVSMDYPNNSLSLFPVTESASRPPKSRASPHNNTWNSNSKATKIKGLP
jgi:hypothetical protein